MEEILLTPSEMRFAAGVACERQIDNLAQGRVDAHGARAINGWQLHIEGCMGEMAAAKAYGLYWSGNLGNLKMADVGRLQVRTRRAHNFDLIVHKSDPDIDPFILMTGQNGRYVVQGWIRGMEAKAERYWSDPSGQNRWAYFVPQRALLSPYSLIREAQRSRPMLGVAM